MANLCVAIGLMLRLFIGWLPDLLTTIFANILLLTGPGLFYVALGQFTGLSYSRMMVISVLTAVLAFLLFFTYVENNTGIRMVIVSLGAVAMIALLVYQLLRTRKTSLRLSADLMLVSFIIYGVFLIVRTSSIALNPPQDAFSNTPVQSATYLLLFAISFFWSTGFILMVSQRLRNDLMEVATIDVLTRIANRRATQLFLEKELSRAQRNNGEFLVLLIDIDDFKQVNDRWGHAVGDQVLANTAEVFQSTLRKQDWVGRWGGEEFLVIVSGPCDGGVLAERIRCEIERSEYRQAGEAFHITVSIGVACANQTNTIDEILKRADDALYQAKNTKNAIRMAQ
jgi:diguanylate cyclase (GGDEF)-like protein